MKAHYFFKKSSTKIIKRKYMFEFTIANLITDEKSFEIHCESGTWKFEKHNKYDQHKKAIEEGMCATTFFAYNDNINIRTSDNNFDLACDEIIDICLLLSFISSKSVVPIGTTPHSDIRFVELGDDFIRCRSILGIPELRVTSLSSFFSNWTTEIYPKFELRNLRLQLSHWLSGQTSFTLEDVYLSAGIQMDMIKQLEIIATGNNLTYYKGMTSASNRYSINQLSNDYKLMRNDIIHEGVLSGSKFRNKTKSDCSNVVAETLNWLDNYVLSVINKKNEIINLPRWKGIDIEHGLPSISRLVKAS
jgi:hypothetical protein